MAFTTPDDAWDFMFENMKSYQWKDDLGEYLPRGALEKVTTREFIKLVASTDKSIFLVEGQLDIFVNRVYHHARIMFATCFYALWTAGTAMNVLKALLDNDVTDDQLPLRRTISTNPRLKPAISLFEATQKHFHVAFFSSNSIQDLSGVTKPVIFEDNPRKSLGNGAFGFVHPIEINPEHHSFSCGRMANNKFALKATTHMGNEPDFHRKMAKLNHPHLLKVLASFTMGSNSYNMIYERADMDLEKFMAENPSPAYFHSFDEMALVRQLCGLARALCVVHNLDDIENKVHLHVPGRTQSGYIHDIKPDNILVFLYKQAGASKYWLRLSDYSTAKVADFVNTISGRNQQSCRTQTIKSTPNYRAPEILSDAGISRPYDLWSLGCVFLEVLVWFVEGHASLKAFRAARFQKSTPEGIRNEAFWFATEDGNLAKAQVREAVSEKMRQLPGKCSGQLRPIVDLIPELLEIDPKKRPTAKKVVEKLTHIQPEAALFTMDVSEDSEVPNVSASQSLVYENESDSESSGFSMVEVTAPTSG